MSPQVTKKFERRKHTGEEICTRCLSYNFYSSLPVSSIVRFPLL